jgi:pimeloyl-ACP methyl ester carboxylesterase
MDCIDWRIKWSNEELEPPLPRESKMAQEPWDDFPHSEVRKLFIDHFVSDWRDQLPRITVPTWVVTSRFTNYYHLGGMEWFAQQLPDGRLSVFEHSGHNIFVSEADAFNRELLAFMAST